MSQSEQNERRRRHAAWFHELDAWTEYWDVYHPETRGRYYFGDGDAEAGLLTLILPHKARPPAMAAWGRRALSRDPGFADAIAVPSVAAAIVEVDDLLSRLFAKHFGDPTNTEVRRDYLEAMLGFATDTLPAAMERYERISDDDPRKRTAGRHTLDGDIMWFAWAMQIEAAELLASDEGHARRALSLAGVAIGCPADYAWRGHRRTRPEYTRDVATLALLRARGEAWAGAFEAAAAETHALYRIREWGHA
jgi:hypothetical protein